MKSIILAAGFGTRLEEITKNKSKCLLKINKKPIIERVVGKIKNHDIYIITNNKFYDDFKKTLSNKIKLINDNTNTNDERLGAIGDLKFFIDKEKINKADLLVIGRDNLFEFNIEDFLNYSKDKTCVALYDIKNIEKAKRFGVVQLNDKNKIINFEEKPKIPKSTLVSTACYKFKAEDITYYLNKYIKENNNKDNLGNFIKYLSMKKPVYGYIFKDKWFDIGTKESLKEAEEYYKKLE